MRYPTISVDDLERLSAQLLSGSDADREASIKWVGEGPEIDLQPLQELATALRSELAELGAGEPPVVGDEFEGPASARLHATLRHVALRVLDDAGFWRYISAVHIWDMAVARQRSTFESQEWTRYRGYIDGRTRSECIPLRMFVRGQLAWTEDGYELASAIPGAADLWRSHIIRIRTSYSRALAQGLVKQQMADKMTTDEVRAHAKRITRVASNVMLHLYDGNEVDELLSELDTRSSGSGT